MLSYLLFLAGQPGEEYLTAAEINQLRNGVNELYENVSNGGTKRCRLLCQGVQSDGDEWITYTV
jgi:hypothetical protein